VLGQYQGEVLSGGSLKFMEERISVSSRLKQAGEAFSLQGKTPLFFAKGEQAAGILAVADTMKEDSKEAVSQLKDMGIHVLMLTGDNEKTAKAIGRQAGVDQVIAGVLPEGKEAVIRQLQTQGRVAMVGDGINDAPALTRADTGIAIGAGTDIAIDAADVVLMQSSLLQVPAAIRLSRATRRNIKENLFWAFFYNAIGIPLAAGVWIPLLGLRLSPMFAAAAMSLSSFCVVSNALRLNLFRLYEPKKKKRRKKKGLEPVSEPKEKEKNTMKKVLEIEGMMCGHCEASVKKALESLPQVEEAKVSHQEKQAVVTLREPVPDQQLKEAVEALEYRVTAVRD
jgi:Cu2+-exporting ATPase